MAGTLSVQKIQGLASSATPTVVEVSNGHALHANTLKGTTTAGSINVQGEGTNTTNLQQGLIKHWGNINGTGTVAIRDSFNVSSLTDRSTGLYNFTFATNFASVNISAHVTVNETTGTEGHLNRYPACDAVSHDTVHFGATFSSSNYDVHELYTSAQGDLA